MSAERFAWIIIYLNIPLWIAIGVLAFAFGQWDAVKIMAGANIFLLLASNLLLLGRRRHG